MVSLLSEFMTCDASVPQLTYSPKIEKSQTTQPSSDQQTAHCATRQNQHATLLAIHLKISGAVVAAERAPPGKNHKVATKLPTRLCEQRETSAKTKDESKSTSTTMKVLQNIWLPLRYHLRRMCGTTKTMQKYLLAMRGCEKRMQCHP